MTVRVSGSWPGSAEHVFSTLIKKLKHTCPSTPIADKLFFFCRSSSLSLLSLSLYRSAKLEEFGCFCFSIALLGNATGPVVESLEDFHLT